LESKNFHIEIEYNDETCIVADKEGLIKLKSAIDKAIESGIHFDDLDEFRGIVCKEKDFFQDKPVYEPSLIGNFFSLLIGLLMFIIFISGVTSIFKWFLNN